MGRGAAGDPEEGGIPEQLPRPREGRRRALPLPAPSPSLRPSETPAPPPRPLRPAPHSSSAASQWPCADPHPPPCASAGSSSPHSPAPVLPPSPRVRSSSQPSGVAVALGTGPPAQPHFGGVVSSRDGTPGWGSVRSESACGENGPAVQGVRLESGVRVSPGDGWSWGGGLVGGVPRGSGVRVSPGEAGWGSQPFAPRRGLRVPVSDAVLGRCPLGSVCPTAASQVRALRAGLWTLRAGDRTAICPRRQEPQPL